MRAAEQDRSEVTPDRRHWRVLQHYTDPDRLVFLDATSATINLKRRYGEGLWSERLGKVNIVNIDQGFHFNSRYCTEALLKAGIAISIGKQRPMARG